MKHVLLDTNVILRFVLDEQSEHQLRAVGLFESAERKELVLVMAPEIMAETIHVLRSYYEFSQAAIAQALEKVMLHIGVSLTDEAVMTDALTSYAESILDIADCLLAARARHTKQAIASFDKDFKKFEGLDRVEF